MRLVGEYLQPEGYSVEAIHNGERGIDRALSNEHDLVVLDVMLPGTNGFDVLRRIRARSRIPVLMLTARGDDVDRIVGLEIGATITSKAIQSSRAGGPYSCRIAASPAR